MWFPVLSLLLITTPNLQGNEDITLPIKELHYKISKIVSKIVEESKMLPDPSELELTEKIEKVLEEYTEIDISSGLPELIELLELKKKADDLKTSKETQKAILDGLDSWGRIGKLESYIVVSLDYELEKMEEKRKGGPVNAYSRLSDLVNNMRNVMERSKTIRQEKEKRKIPINDNFYDWRDLVDLQIDFSSQYWEFYGEFKEVDTHPISFDFVEDMKTGIAGGKEKSAEIRKWNEDSEISQNILSVNAEIQLMEELRDGEAIQRMLRLIEKLEGSFEGMRGPELKPLQYQISYSLRKMTPIRNHLKRLNISSGNLTDPLGKIESCLQNYDFSMDFSTEEEELKKIEESLNEIPTKNEQFSKLLDQVQEFRKKFKESSDEVDKYPIGWDTQNGYPDWMTLRKIWLKFEQSADVQPLSILLPKLDNKVAEVRDLLNKLDFNEIRTVSNRIRSKVSKINEFLDCQRTLEILPADIKSLMDQPGGVWNFDPKSLELALEVVYLFKEAHRLLVNQKSATANKFPLTREEVSEVSEGLRILEALLNFQKFWAKNSGKFSSTLADQLSHVEDIFKIQFSPDPYLDSIINFYSTQYQGRQRTQILKTLEAVKDTSEFAVKLEKMNEGIRKYLGTEPQGIEEKELIDCLENTCPLPSLPEVIRKNL
ncbi:unnamed protein product [Caenorhabditis brenneri]